jgi:hypothetical protein
MPRKKKISFRLNPEWMFKEPIDFEYNKYTLLDYLQKCENRFDKLEIYPDFVELSLHLANLQSLIKENTIFSTDKKFEDCDDEILLKELTTKKPPTLDEEGQEELTKTLKFSAPRVFDTFNIGKSIWNIAYDNISISLKKNKENIESGTGFVVFFDKEISKVYIWEYNIKKQGKKNQTNKNYLNLIYEGEHKEKTLTSIISDYTTWKDNDGFKFLPVFEVKTSQKFPLNETLVPMIRRKITAYIFQIVNFKKLQNFDELK